MEPLLYFFAWLAIIQKNEKRSRGENENGLVDLVVEPHHHWRPCGEGGSILAAV